MKTVRATQEELEAITLSPHACKSVQTRGRRRPEPDECDLRTDFQRDRDRIIHSKTFRRLKHKTQVFLAPAGDHYRTRLTHVLEVSQIARTMAACLRLNEYLTEAIALGHDLGHTPFGHAGEFTLNQLHPTGFRHFVQSLRIVDFLENDGQGLNLTWEVRNGIVKHSKGYGPILPDDGATGLAATLEGQLVRVADIMAYVNHDMDDAIRAGMIAPQDLPAHLRHMLGERSSQRVHAMVRDLVRATLARDDGALHLSPKMTETITELRSFLYHNVYSNYRVHGEFVKAQRIIRELYAWFLEHELPDGNSWLSGGGDDPLFARAELPPPADANEERRRHRRVCDFIAGMTDRYAITLYTQLFVPRPWSVM